jgi:hypothetical protein
VILSTFGRGDSGFKLQIQPARSKQANVFVFDREERGWPSGFTGGILKACMIAKYQIESLCSETCVGLSASN